jgi:hypothetical protein
MAKPQLNLAAQARRRSGGGSRFYVVLALGLPLAVVMLPSFIVIAAAMVPTLVAWLIDPRGRRYLAVTVGSLNFAGALFFLVALWSDDHDIAHAFGVLRDIYGWLVAYGAAAAGYGIHYAMPTMTDGIARLRAAAHLNRLEREMRGLVDEWGEPVAAPPTND